MALNKEQVLNSLTLLAQAYAFAKDGQADIAGNLFVQAAEDGNLDEVMDGVAQTAEELDDSDFEDMDDDTEGEGDDDGEDGEDGGKDTAPIEANVKLPESVARLAARTLV